MTSITPSLRLVVITMVVGCVVASLTGATAKERGADNGTLKMAVVNPLRIIQESKYYKAETDKLTKLQQDTSLMIRTWDNNSLLAAADQQALGELTIEDAVPGGLADANKKSQKQKLEAKGKELFDQSVALQTKQQLTQAENDRLREFAKLDADTKQREQSKAQEVKAKIDSQFAAVRDKSEKDFRESMNKIAKKDGYNLVFSADVVLYAEKDITDAVLSDLNK